jgi:hypothetical protein
MGVLRSFTKIFSVTTLVVAGLASASTLLCRLYKIYGDFPLTLIGIAVVFPIVFSISGAYNRREAALRHYSIMKSHGRAIYLGSRDWLPKRDEKRLKRLKKILLDILDNSRIYFNTPKEEQDKKELDVYRNFSKLSTFINEGRKLDMPPGDVSRMNQYESKIIDAFESMKHISQYRTPITLRAYSKIFIFVLPVLYGPYFAKLSSDYPFIFLFFVPVLFSIILVALDNVQDDLENPFDQIGEDDVRINAEKFVKGLDP